ncbi:MAG: DUF4034 domain-containing protein [Acidobacteriaceae bacterium]|jgi:hypothetical protein
MRFICVSSIASLALGFVLFPITAAARLAPQPQKLVQPGAGAVAESRVEEESVVVRELKASLADSLLHGKYDEIERVADKIRTDKTRLAGGGWLLKQVYFGLEAANGTTPEEHIAELKAWIVARPQSITAHVALAKAYTSYAWLARGGGNADTVTAERRKRFTERIAEAKRALDESANITPMDPEWFAEMQTVALAQSWDAERSAALFNKAVAFEPTYFYFYKYYANYLQPKWDGQEGEAAAFAKKSADAVGGPEGDFLYFHIAMVVLAANNGKVDAAQMDWERLQRGYQAQRDLYGVVSFDRNQFALMAWRFRDRDVARPIFNEIGDKWSKEVWGNRTRFETAREWAGK